MRAVKHRAHAVEGDPNPRPVALADFSAADCQKSFDVAPRNAGANRIGEDGPERGAVRFVQGLIVSEYSINARALGPLCARGPAYNNQPDCVFRHGERPGFISAPGDDFRQRRTKDCEISVDVWLKHNSKCRNVVRRLFYPLSAMNDSAKKRPAIDTKPVSHYLCVKPPPKPAP